MSHKTFGSIFTGGGLADEGAKAAGYVPIWGIEINLPIAQVANVNGHPVTVSDVLDIDPKTLQVPDLFHASPVCTNASVANKNGKESELDIACGKKTAEFIRVLKPQYVTIENVSGYKYFQAFREIMKALEDCGYFYDVDILNAADFGVPQSRRRLFVRAVRGGLVPHLPEPTTWRGWYESVEDLIPTFPETQFAPWQLARLPEEIKTFIFNENRTSMKWIQASDVNDITQPYATVTTNNHFPRAYLVGQQKFGDVLNISEIDQPSMTLTAQHNQRNIRAFIVSDGQGDVPRRAVDNGTPNDYGKSVTIRDESEPIFTLTASETKRPARMWTENGKVVKITPRGLARFQTLRDSYILPSNDTLAVKVIGNGIPCLMYQRIAEAFPVENESY